jgi:hypothetical protein
MKLGDSVRHLNSDFSDWKGTVVADPYLKWKRSDTPQYETYLYVRFHKGERTDEGWYPERVLVRCEETASSEESGPAIRLDVTSVSQPMYATDTETQDVVVCVVITTKQQGNVVLGMPVELAQHIGHLFG